MNHLHRFYAQHAAQVWQLEGRWMAARGTFRAPVAVQWLSTQACDLACAHCYSNAGRRAPDELTTAEALRLVDDVADLGAETFVIAGGEPLLRRDLRQVVEHAVSRGLKWSVHTHGGQVLRHRELFEEVPASLVAVSLDGSRPVHDALRGEGSYDKAIAAIQFLVQHTSTTQVVAGTTVHRRNADSVLDMMDDVIASQANTWGLHLFAPEGRGSVHRDMVPTDGQLRRVAALTRRMRRRMDVDLDNEWGSAGVLDPFYRDQPFLCGAGRFTFVVGPSGHILPCTTTALEESEGNVRTDSLGEVWQRGFSRFRSNGDAACSDGADCWLQTRNGNSCRKAAFGVDPVPVHVPSMPAPTGRLAKALRTLATLALAASAPTVAAAATPDFPDQLDTQRWALHGVHPLPSEDGVRVRADSAWSELKSSPSEATAGAFPKVSAALLSGYPLPSKQLIAALDEAEGQHVWDPWLVFALWHCSQVDADTAELFARLERHARVVDALVLAAAVAGPVHFLPWRKKSAPPPGYSGLHVPSALLVEARRVFATTDAGTWRHEATIELTLSAGTARLHRNGEVLPISAGARIRLARFDLVELDGTLRHATLGPVVSGSHVVSSRGLASQLNPAASTPIARSVKAAMAGDQAGVDQLESMLPASHEAIRAAVNAQPKAEGAAALRQLLVLFDE